jgi:NTP pyrophosphatase (non-canonical NTP hydrolase)
MDRHNPIELVNGASIPPEEDRGALDDRVVQARLKELAWCMTEELAEAVNHLKNRPWKMQDRPTDVGAFHEEIADFLHFFLEFCITAGISAEFLSDEYDRKLEINHERIDDGV